MDYDVGKNLEILFAEITTLKEELQKIRNELDNISKSGQIIRRA